ncbi:hypothetical protein HNR46_004263 [Haloferula luteola]|uniref:Uncharacterized protein n=1 Tax=Haloferula luteola TaxID=595692 RepID=A0A840VN03_9BACT|nr:hypothetical protein [Haloferula luteola]
MLSELTTFLACPQCTFNRFQPSWYFFAALRLAIVGLICWKRMDIVRVLGIAVFLEIPYFLAWRIGVIWMYAERPGTNREEAAGLYEALFSAGILHALLLLVMSRFRYFRVTNAPRIRFLRIALIVPAFLLSTYFHSAFAYSPFSSSVR